MNNTHKKETLTFYRRMANTNPIIMKKYKSAIINKMTHTQIINIYTENNIKLDEDIDRLKNFKKPIITFGKIDYKFLQKTKYFKLFLPIDYPFTLSSLCQK